MQISPPIAVLAILAVGLAATASYAPIRSKATSGTVTISSATYETLALWGQERVGADGRPLTVAQAIEELTQQMKGVETAPAD